MRRLRSWGRRRGAAFLAFALAAPGLLSAEDGFLPDEIDGLEAWYAASSLAQTLSSGDPVALWKDNTGRHDLRHDGNGESAVWIQALVHDQPAVQVRTLSSYSVQDPFTLGPHTVFLVYKTAASERALFRSDQSEFHGLLLRREGNHDRYQNGGPGDAQVLVYNTPLDIKDRFAVTVLARNGDTLRSFIDGADVSAGSSFAGPVRVGKLFALSHTTFAKRDGNGLFIAEILFYSRYLPEQERQAVTAYLSDKYGLGVPAPTARRETAGGAPQQQAARLAQLNTSTRINLNQTAVAIPWDGADELDPPFAHEAGSTRLASTADARVRLYVSLPLVASGSQPGVRVLFCVNGERYLPGEGRSVPFALVGEEYRSVAQAEVVTRLHAGDSVEVVVVGDGGEGTVNVKSGAAVFLAELR